MLAVLMHLLRSLGPTANKDGTISLPKCTIVPLHYDWSVMVIHVVVLKDSVTPALLKIPPHTVAGQEMLLRAAI